MIKAGLLALASLVVLAFVACESDDPLSSSSVTSLPTAVSATAAPAPSTAPGTVISTPAPSGPPAFTIDVNKEYTAVIVTDKGDIHIKLFPAEVPNTVNNFVHLARTGFYDGVTFHRVIPGFMAQTGDPTGSGMGGPGYKFADEFHPDLRHDKAGVVSMANSGFGTNGSQFFITYTETLFLDGLNPDGSPKDCQSFQVSCHAVFGKVIEGMDVLNAISPRDPQLASKDGDVIKTIRIIES